MQLGLSGHGTARLWFKAADGTVHGDAGLIIGATSSRVQGCSVQLVLRVQRRSLSSRVIASSLEGKINVVEFGFRAFRRT